MLYLADISERRTCQLVEISRTVLHYVPKMQPENEQLQHRMVELASGRRRFGYRRIHALLRREGVDVNHKTHLSPNSASAFFLLPGTFWLIVPHMYTCLSPLGRLPGSLPLKLPGFSLN
jgi:hypothetical protein